MLLVNTPVNSTQNENVSNPGDHHNLDLSTIPRLPTRNPTLEPSLEVPTVIENEDSQHTVTTDEEDYLYGF